MINTCQICRTPTLFSKNMYCETCANNFLTGLNIISPNLFNKAGGWAIYHKDKNLGGHMQEIKKFDTCDHVMAIQSSPPHTSHITNTNHMRCPICALGGEKQ